MPGACVGNSWFLIFVRNDYVDNFTILRAMLHGLNPERYPFVSGKRNRQGVIGRQTLD